MPTAYATVIANDTDGEHDQRCGNGYTPSGHNDHSSHCGGWIQHSTRVARTARGRQTRRRCTGICSSGKINYAAGSTGHPCDGANHIRLTQNEGSFAGGSGEPNGVLECTWNNIDGNTLKSMSTQAKYTSGGVRYGPNAFTVYEQLLYGYSNMGQSNYNSTGFCGDAANLETVVDNNGQTCYQKLTGKLSEAALKQKGIDYCKANPSDNKCKCINVARSDFLTFCESNPSLPGCNEINTARQKYENVGVLRTATGLMGNQDCLVPGICGGNIYEPQTMPQTCQNQIGICDQVQNVSAEKLAEAAELSAFQNCNIEFQVQRERNESTSGSPSGVPSNIDDSSGTGAPPGSAPPAYEEGSLAARLDAFRSRLPEGLRGFVPVTVDELKTDRSKQIGVGGVGFGTIISSVLCILLVLLLASGNETVRGRFRRR